MKIAILGWGSLLWDDRPEFAEFNEQHEDWKPDGPSLKLEFSRVSARRQGALTLVIDKDSGCLCKVASAISKRTNLDHAIRDLRIREDTVPGKIGYCFSDGRKPRARDGESLQSIQQWATRKKASEQVDAVIWTDLEPNFAEKSTYNTSYSPGEAIRHLNSLGNDVKLDAAEYVRKAPAFIETQLRKALRSRHYLDHTLTHGEIAVAAYFIRENENRRQGFEEHGHDIEDWFSGQDQLKRRYVCVE